MSIDKDKSKSEEDHKTEAYQLKKDLESAKSPLDLNVVLDKIHSSSLPNEMKDALIAIATKMVIDLETEKKHAIGGNKADSNHQETLKPGSFEQKRFDDEVAPIYNEFDKFHVDFLKKQTTHNDLLDKALEEMTSGKGITEDTKKLLLDSEEALKNEKVRLEHIRLTRLVATDQQKFHLGKISEIDKELSIIDAPKKDNSLPPLSGLTKPELLDAKTVHLNLLGKANTKLEEVKKHDEAFLKTEKIIARGLEEAIKRGSVKEQDFWKKQTTEFILPPEVKSQKGQEPGKQSITTSIPMDKASKTPTKIGSKFPGLDAESAALIDKIKVDYNKHVIKFDPNSNNKNLLNVVESKGKGGKGGGRGDI